MERSAAAVPSLSSLVMSPHDVVIIVAADVAAEFSLPLLSPLLSSRLLLTMLFIPFVTATSRALSSHVVNCLPSPSALVSLSLSLPSSSCLSLAPCLTIPEAGKQADDESNVTQARQQPEHGEHNRSQRR